MITNRNKLDAYGQVGLDAKVASASPHRLITMLFDGAIAAVAKARFHIGQAQPDGRMEPNDIAQKGEAISRAIAIIDDGLRASLNLEVGGELSANLYALYEYMSHRLVQANLSNDLQILEEISLRLTELRDAWSSIEFKQTDNSRVPDERTVGRSGVVTYGRV